ncbi:MAG TPA: response regulator [Chloroflexi bacterium]|nr:response regulator [Chloroflexota bacterium]
MCDILVVDDDPTFSGLIKTVLEFEGYKVIVEPNPDLVLSKASQFKPVLLLMDVYSERGDTLEVLRDVRAVKSFDDTAIVMTSGMDRAADCLGAGADAFILKPFRPDELIELIADTLSGKEGDS